jgi:hypothetical protein
MWMLVFINIAFTPLSGYDEAYIQATWNFNTMEECFEGRDLVLAELEIYDGFPPKGIQLVCINFDQTTENKKEKKNGILKYHF